MRSFHPSPHRNDDHSIPNHYEVLDLPTDAPQAEVKKQFYKLSKSHHPDLHPTDPTASQRFVAISEAYATLGSPEKRLRYDRDFLSLRTHEPSRSGGSFSSSSSQAQAGGRAPSGLSRRRGQFRGPPPSFYRSGGWGQHAEKRSEHASKASHTYEATGQAQSGASAGMGPGGLNQGFNDDVPHFDHRGHYQTHSGIERTRHKARQRMRTTVTAVEEDAETDHRGGSTLFGFVMLSGVLAAVLGVPLMIGSVQNSQGKQKSGKG